MSRKNPEDTKAYKKAYDRKDESKQRNRDNAKRWARLHPDEIRARNGAYSTKLLGRERRHFLKLKVLSQYSNPIGMPICNNCGEQDIEVLCIDHLEGGGNKQRELLGTKGGLTFYYWLVKNNFPIGYQVLCANCNTKKVNMNGGILVKTGN